MADKELELAFLHLRVQLDTHAIEMKNKELQFWREKYGPLEAAEYAQNMNSTKKTYWVNLTSDGMWHKFANERYARSYASTFPQGVFVKVAIPMEFEE